MQYRQHRSKIIFLWGHSYLSTLSQYLFFHDVYQGVAHISILPNKTSWWRFFPIKGGFIKKRVGIPTLAQYYQRVKLTGISTRTAIINIYLYISHCFLSKDYGEIGSWAIFFGQSTPPHLNWKSVLARKSPIKCNDIRLVFLLVQRFSQDWIVGYFLFLHKFRAGIYRS